MTSATRAAGRTSHLDDALRRIEGLLRVRPGHSAHGSDLVSLMKLIATHFGAGTVNPPGPEPGEPLASAVPRLAECVGFVARRIKVDGNLFSSGVGSVLCSRTSDDRLVALVRDGGRWKIYGAAEDGQAVLLDDAIQKDLSSEGYLVAPGLPAKPLTQWDVMSFGWRQTKGAIVGNLLLNALAGLVLVMFPIVTGSIIEVVVPGREAALLAAIVGFLLVLCALHLVVKIASDLTALRIQGVAGSMLRNAMIDRAVRIPQEDHADVPPAIMALAVRAVESWRRATWGLGQKAISGIAMALPSLFMMLVLAPVPGLCVIAAATIAVAIALQLAMRQRAAMMAGDAGPGSWMVTAYETMLNIETVRASGAEPSLFARWIESFAALQERQLASSRVAALSTGVLAGLEALLILVAVAAIVLSGTTTHVASAISFVMATGTVVSAVAVLIGAAGEITGLSIQKRLAKPLLAAVPAQGGKGARLGALQGSVRAAGITYRHSPDCAPTLDTVDLVAEPGEYIGIAGVSGSGKTTLLDVLLGLRAPQSGAVYLDGVDIRKLDMRHARQCIGIVGQGASLFPGTLRDNVCLGTSRPDEEIFRYLDLAGVGREIAALPLGLGTLVSDNNPMFSGGQIQRILLARALAMQPKLIVLDEATSAIDAKTQADITQRVRDLGITVIAVAHRLETLKDCDRIYVLDQGRIAQVGPFATLASESGRFRQLVDAARAA